jgi:hypothetical protein
MDYLDDIRQLFWVIQEDIAQVFLVKCECVAHKQLV